MLNGAKACFIAALPVLKGDASYGLTPVDYTEYGQIVAYMSDGTTKIYGDPMSNRCKKLHAVVQAVADGVKGDGPCGLDAIKVPKFDTQ